MTFDPNTLRQCKFGTSFKSLTSKFSRSKMKDAKQAVGSRKFDRFLKDKAARHDRRKPRRGRG